MPKTLNAYEVFCLSPVKRKLLAVAETDLVIFCEPADATTLIPVTLPLAKAAQVNVAVVGVVATATLVGLETAVTALASIPRIPMVSAASKREADAFLVVFIFHT
jgi:hypothetical protein